MEQVQVNLAYRWYLGYDLDETVPDHSSLSKIRTCYGLEVFQLFFEKVVELCIEAGLVWGKNYISTGRKFVRMLRLQALRLGGLSKLVNNCGFCLSRKLAKLHFKSLCPVPRARLRWNPNDRTT